MSNVYRRLGIRPIINANTTLTRLGGSLMPPPVLDAMRQAARAYVDVFELEAAVSRRIAVLTRNESALVTSGAAAGLFLAALGAQTGPDPGAISARQRLGPGAAARREFVVQTAQRNPYDLALTLAGARLVQVGNVWLTESSEVESAIGPRTAALVFFAGAHLASGALSFAEFAEIGRGAGVPVIVDAAAQLPPRENLWRYTQAGAIAAVFSGGKGLRGPGPSGLILGESTFVEACRLHAFPRQRLGRPMKLGKEEIAGLLAAVEWYLERDEAAEVNRCEDVVGGWVRALHGLPGVSACRDFPGEAGRPLPRVIVSLHAGGTLTGASLRDALLASETPVDVAIAGDRSIYLNPELLQPGEEETVVVSVQRVLRELAPIGVPEETAKT